MYKEVNYIIVLLCMYKKYLFLFLFYIVLVLAIPQGAFAACATTYQIYSANAGGRHSGFTGKLVNTATGATLSSPTNASGFATFNNVCAGTYSICITDPGDFAGCSTADIDGNANSGTQPAPICPGQCPIATSTPTPTPTPAPLYSISGTIYNDANADQHMDNGEQAVIGSSTVTITNSSNVVVKTINTNDGTYTTGETLQAGTYTVSYTSLPEGYYITYPLNETPPSFTVTVGGSGACKPTAYNDEVCNY